MLPAAIAGILWSPRQLGSVRLAELPGTSAAALAGQGAECPQPT